MSDNRSSSWNSHEPPVRNVGEAMLRGVALRCPACGQGKLYRAFLKVADNCPSCGEELHHQRADDAPPYFTIVIVGHVVVPLVLVVERAFAPALWLQALGWTAVIIAMSLMLLPSIKGALVGMQWANYMHGFDPRSGGQEDWSGLDPDFLASAKSER